MNDFLPEDVTRLTAKQNKSIIESFARLPLRELRKRQNLCEQQTAAAAKRYAAGSRDTNLLHDIIRLSKTSEQLLQAVDLRVFVWKLEKA